MRLDGKVSNREPDVKARIVDVEALRAVSPKALSAYALAEGWTPLEPYGVHSQVYKRGDSRHEIIIPGTAALGDYASVVSDLLKAFSEVEDRDELQVYRDLANADRDVVRIRSPEADSDGSVCIEAGVDLVVHARDLVLSAACAAWDPRPTYRAGRIKQADDYMSRVRLGQTEQGSFVVTLLAPVPPALERQADFWPHADEEPYERLVTRRLAGSLDTAAQAIEKLNLGAGIAIFENAVGQGVSANLCEAAANLSDQGDGVEVSITWARTRPTPQARWARKFTRAEGQTLREVARHFHERQPRPEERLQGYVVQLARRETVSDGRVTISAWVDGKPTSIQAELERRDYELALRAHDCRRPISAVGTLERKGHRWKLINPTNVRLVDDEDGDETNSAP